MAYPFRKYNYAVVIDGIKQAGFSEVSAADVTVESIDYREGNFKRMSSDKISGLAKYGNVTLKWGTTDNLEFYNWLVKTSSGDTVRKNVTIQLMDGTNEKTLAQWELSNAWPSKYTMPDFKATESAIAVESIELNHEGLKRTQ